MSVPLSQAMRSVLILLRVLIVLNLACFGLFLLMLAGSFTDVVASALAKNLGDASLEQMLIGLRAVMVIGLLTVPVAHLLLTRLRDIVQTVGAGDPFVPSNARRLTTIAWCLLAIQVLDLGFGAASYTTGHEFGWSFSLTGWLAVILLFVLAKVFEHGSTMRDELAGTV